MNKTTNQAHEEKPKHHFETLNFEILGEEASFNVHEFVAKGEKHPPEHEKKNDDIAYIFNNSSVITIPIYEGISKEEAQNSSGSSNCLWCWFRVPCCYGYTWVQLCVPPCRYMLWTYTCSDPYGYTCWHRINLYCC